MNCRSVHEMLSEYIDGALSVQDTETVRRHLDTCPECRDAAKSMARIVARMNAAEPVREPADFTAKVAARLDRRGGFGRRVLHFFSPARGKLRLGIAAAAVALVVTVYFSGLITPPRTFEIVVALDQPSPPPTGGKKSGPRGGTSDPAPKRGPVGEETLVAMIESLKGTIIDTRRLEPDGALAGVTIELAASHYDSLLKKCEELGILLESPEDLPKDTGKTVTIRIRVRSPGEPQSR